MTGVQGECFRTFNKHASFAVVTPRPHSKDVAETGNSRHNAIYLLVSGGTLLSMEPSGAPDV